MGKGDFFVAIFIQEIGFLQFSVKTGTAAKLFCQKADELSD